MDKTLESFIEMCDDLVITEEGLFKSKTQRDAEKKEREAKRAEELNKAREIFPSLVSNGKRYMEELKRSISSELSKRKWPSNISKISSIDNSDRLEYWYSFTLDGIEKNDIELYQKFKDYDKAYVSYIVEEQISIIEKKYKEFSTGNSRYGSFMYIETHNTTEVNLRINA